jgi:pimeloyl-ACP methyl ester carboxylesterase
VVAPFMRGCATVVDSIGRQRHWTSAPTLPSRYLHGHDDGCTTPAFADSTPRALSDGSDVTIVEHAGHFLQLDEPEKVAELVPRFIGSAG